MSVPTPAGSDRNLLFGILALQLDFISRDALVAAMHAWVLDKARPLGLILVAQQALSAERRALLEGLVQEHLKQHGGDPQQSLAAVSSIKSVREQLQQLADADVQASLAHVAAARKQEEEDPFATQDPVSAGTPTSTGLRFRILRPHARGGLGQVYVAHDEELKREVALKEIQNRYADDHHSRSRFLLEAEITGGLEHPGIVPVYGLGQYADGRPFYAMRFIRGDNLQDAISRFHKAELPGRDPGERALALRGLLRRFLDVCNAVAYAHSRGVLHRDLKPGNVMLGRYGETLVVDWGLAKSGGAAESAGATAEGPLVPAAASGSAPTEMGRALGTPAYMSPEQAAGRLDLLGPATDVYSLGATLYHLLSGRPPFTDDPAGDILQRVQRGDFPPVRRVKAGVPAALEAVCRKAMAVRPEDRYATVPGLAEDVDHWLADEPVSAYREPLAKRLGRWRRRHPALAAAAAVLLLAVVGLGVWLKLERDALELDVSAALAEVERLQEGAKWAEARATLERARGRLAGGGPAELRRRVRQAEIDLEMVAELEDVRLRQAEIKDGRLDTAGADPGYEAAFRRYGIDAITGDLDQTARRVATTAVRAQLVVALDHWASVRPLRDTAGRERLLALARLTDEDPWRGRLRNAKVFGDREALVRLAGEPEVLAQPPTTALLLADRLKLAGDAARAEGVLRRAQLRHPEDFWLNMSLGLELSQSRDPAHKAEAIGFYRAALAARPGNSAVQSNLGAALEGQGKLKEAEAAYREALRRKPDFPEAHTNLGNTFAGQGKLKEAEAAYREALRRKPDFPEAHTGLGHALEGQGKLKEAEAAYRKALRRKPDDPLAHYSLGGAFVKQGKFTEAEVAYREALRRKPDFPKAHCNLGYALAGQGKFKEAEAAFCEALRRKPDLLGAHIGLSTALDAQGKFKEAEAACREALRVEPDSAGAHSNLGHVLAEQGKFTEAEALYREALRRKPDFPEAHYNLGNAFAGQGKLTAAEAAFREAIRLKPDYPEANCNLGFALRGQGRFAESRASLKRGHQLGSKNPRWRYPSPSWLREAEQLVVLDQKLSAILAGTAQPADVAERIALVQCAKYKQLYATATRLYAEAFAAQPQLADDRKTLHRYDAACFAALAGSGKGTDSAKLDSAERARLRRQALDWLRAELTVWARPLEGGKPANRAAVQRTMQHWQTDADLVGIRDAAALRGLPEDEREAFRSLWADVAALLKKASAPTP